MEVDAPRADVTEQRGGIHRRKNVAHLDAERIAPAIADGPQAEGKLVFGTRCVDVGHG